MKKEQMCFSKIVLLLVFALMCCVMFVACDQPTSHPHAWSPWAIVRDATCAEEGLQKKTCECGAEETQRIEKTSHNYETTHVSPTISEQGYARHVCSNCGEKYNDSYTPVLEATINVNEDGQTCTITELWLDYSCVAKTDNNDVNVLIVPSEIDGYKVTIIGEKACQSLWRVKSIVIPDSVTSIGQYAFYKCSSFESITIPASVTSIDDYAFYGCSSLKSITIPDSVTSIDSYAFAYCSSLTSVIIPDSVTSIGRYAFNDCSSLTSVIIPDSVTSIGGYAFNDCSSLENVTLSNTLSKISQHTFMNCKSLTNITIPDSVAYIGDGAFGFCSSLADVILGHGVTSLYSYAFYGCSSLTSIIIPNGVKSIGSYAFFDCSSLTSIVIPDSVTIIGAHAFYECSGLTTVYYGGTASSWSNISIGSFNSQLTSQFTSATRYYYSENRLTNTTYRYWHYVNGVPTKW